ncbi:ribose-phosphate pyrophosphokinase [Saitoella complicata NRRL Y-17804]|nr:ribose-phosphate pyrophosphokinase [Saitoella complicata NRRL Y-17804]ODQ54808.1 ribose-phosphate pyrophosphokinase [Saitoella complicata NRRL Y-17804]
MTRNLVVFGTSSHPILTSAICDRLGIAEGNAQLGKFSNGETSVQIFDSVREKDVYIISPGSGHVNNNLMELLIMISACKTASAKKVTAILPVFPYSRQPDSTHRKTGAPLLQRTVKEIEKSAGTYTFESRPGTPAPTEKKGFNLGDVKDKELMPPPSYNGGGRPPVEEVMKKTSGYKDWIAQAGTLVADLLTCAGADHIITMDLHDPQFQGFFDIPVDNLYGRPLLQRYIVSQIPNYQDAVIVSPDAGGAKRATAIADSLQMDFALIHKERRPNRPKIGDREVASMMLVGDVEGKVAILIDDLLDTGNTITRAAKVVKDHGATAVYALTTHGIFSGDAIQRINASALDHIITTNTTPQEENLRLCSKLDIIDVAPVFAEAVRRIHNGESVSMLFDYGM